MRHGNKINNLSRTKSHRKSLLNNLAIQLLINKRIITTLSKAKALKVYIEPFITKTKKNYTKELIMNQHRIVFSCLQNKEAVKELFTVIGPKVASRLGGYTRIVKIGTRLGDNAELALIELVDFNTVYEKVTTKELNTNAQTRKSRRGKSKKVGGKMEGDRITTASNESDDFNLIVDTGIDANELDLTTKTNDSQTGDSL